MAEWQNENIPHLTHPNRCERCGKFVTYELMNEALDDGHPLLCDKCIPIVQELWRRHSEARKKRLAKAKSENEVKND